MLKKAIYLILVFSLFLALYSCSDEEKERASVQIFTTEIDFGDNAVGIASQARSFEIKNISTGITLKIEELRFEDTEHFSVSNISKIPFDIDGGESQLVEVVFSPDEIGDYESVLRVISNAANRSNIAIRLYGKGVQ